MSLLVTKYPKSERINVTAASYGTNAKAKLLATVSYLNTNVKIGDKIGVFTDVYAGFFDVLNITQGTTTSNSYITIDTAYSADATGFLFTETIPINSYWNAVKDTPLTISFLRQSLLITSIVNAGGKILITPTAAPSAISIGDTIYINSGGVYIGFYTVTAVSFTKIACDEAFISETTGGYLDVTDYATDYRVALTISSKSNDIELSYYLDTTGSLEVNINSILESLLNTKDEFNYEDVSVKDDNIAGYFTVSYQEVYTGSTETLQTIPQRFYYNLAQRTLNEYSNMFEYLVRSGGILPLAKFLNFGMPTVFLNEDGYIQYPFSIDILSQTGIVQKIETLYDQSGVQIGSPSSSLLEDSSNALNRISLENSYLDTVKNIDVYLYESVLNIEHFSTVIGSDGIVYDSFGNQDGSLIDGNCIEFKVGGTSTIVLPELILPEAGTITHNGTADALTAVNNTLFDSGTGGTVFNLEFEDPLGNTYIFPCVENYENITNYAYLIAGIKTDISTFLTSIIYAFATDIEGFSTQDSFFWQAQYGMTKNVNAADITQIIWTPKTTDKVIMYCIGLDNEDYTANFAPIE